jgi:hypothetical protein
MLVTSPWNIMPLLFTVLVLVSFFSGVVVVVVVVSVLYRS